MFLYSDCYGFLEQNLILVPYTSYLSPAQFIPQQKDQVSLISQIKSSPIKDDINRVMIKALQIKHQKSKSKLWTQQEDALLLQLAQNQVDWEKIKEKFQGKNANVCKRRYKRLIKQNKKWPKQSQDLIKHLYQYQKLCWADIQKYLPCKIQAIFRVYKETNQVEIEIKRIKWTVDEDLKLWKLVKQHGNSWVKFTKLFNGRSQLQLKNRYNKSIKPVYQDIFGGGKVENNEFDQKI